MDVVARASELSAAGEDVVMLCVGQPSAQAPFAAREAARERIANGPIGYTSSGGIEALRRRISQHYRERYGVDLDPARVVVTTGSSAGFMLAFLALFENGERVAIPSPGYPAYRNILKALSLQALEIETTASDRWVVTADALEKAHGDNPISGILIANPNNPNGTMMKPDAFEQLWKRAEDLGIAFISDEISRLDLRHAGKIRIGVYRRCDRHQFVLQIFLYDGLADRLDGGPGRIDRDHHQIASEPVHQRARGFTGRGASCVRWIGRA